MSKIRVLKKNVEQMVDALEDKGYEWYVEEGASTVYCKHYVHPFAKINSSGRPYMDPEVWSTITVNELPYIADDIWRNAGIEKSNLFTPSSLVLSGGPNILCRDQLPDLFRCFSDVYGAYGVASDEHKFLFKSYKKGGKDLLLYQSLRNRDSETFVEIPSFISPRSEEYCNGVLYLLTNFSVYDGVDFPFTIVSE